MAAEKKIQRRLEARSVAFVAETKLSLKIDNFERLVSLRPVDVSARGLGFITDVELKPGVRVHLLIGERSIRVEIAYCSSHLGIEGLFRCGLFTWEPTENLERIFRDLDLLGEMHK